MTEEEYKAAIEQYKAEHSASGSLEHGAWKKHKYIRIENGRYIYPEDEKGGSNRAPIGKQIENKVKSTINAFKEAGRKIGEAVQDHKNNKAAEDSRKVEEAIKNSSEIKLENKVKLSEKSSGKSPKERIQSGEATPDDIRKEIKAKSDAMKTEVEEMAKKYVGGATAEATEFEPDTGVPQRFVIKDSNGTIVLDTGNFLKEYDEWNYSRSKKIQHSYTDTKSFYAAVYDYKQAHKR